jgi:uncharacterized repeat protein (TIGR03803 family)
VVFRLSPTGTETILHTFSGGVDGRFPHAGLTRDAAGNLYGTTVGGGPTSTCQFSNGCGVVFELIRCDSAPSGYDFKVLHAFTGSDGAQPAAGLIRDATGNLYGTATSGGAHGQGVVFKLSPGGTYTVLYSFTGGADGAEPIAGLVRDAAGNLYGTTQYGGATSTCSPPLGCGVVFKLSPTGTETVLHSFTRGADGAFPYAGLIQDAAGNLYGTAVAGGATSGVCGLGGCGVVFKLSPTGTETVLHTFTGGDGEGPEGDLIRDATGNVYGTASSGGPGGFGVVFKLTP